MVINVLAFSFGCAGSDVEDEIGELRERIAVLEAQSGSTSSVDLSEIESRLGSLESGLAQTNDSISQIESEIESIKSSYITSDEVLLLEADMAQNEQRISVLETYVSSVQSSVDDLTNRTSTLESEYLLLSQEVDTVSVSVADIQSHGPQIFQISGTYGAYISSSAWTTLSGSELAMVIPYSGLVSVIGSVSLESAYCSGDLTVELIDSTNTTIGSGNVVSFTTNPYGIATGSIMSIGNILVPSAGNYTARIRYNGGSTGGGSCWLTTYQTDAAFFPNP